MQKFASESVMGENGSVSAANPLAVSAALEIFSLGGNAADAAIAAQAVLCVVAPEACGLGGDGLSLIATSTGEVLALNGTGRWGEKSNVNMQCSDGGNSVTIPGITTQWSEMASRFGKLSLSQSLLPAINIAEDGHRLTDLTAKAVESQKSRLIGGGASDWCVFSSKVGDLVKQPCLAESLRSISENGKDWIRSRGVANSVITAVRQSGGNLNFNDFESHEIELGEPPKVNFSDGWLTTQPPMSQGILLSMVANFVDENVIKVQSSITDIELDHLLIELTEGVFQYRDQVSKGKELFSFQLTPNRFMASRIGGPRAYLHTAGVATADSEGLVVSSLVSVFDDFGSCIFVPEIGVTLNNRAGSFTAGDNRPQVSSRPVHTLAPAIWSGSIGTIGLATPGADGQIQTLIQVLSKWLICGYSISEAISMPRWRSEFRSLLIEESHQLIAKFGNRGHQVEIRSDGAGIFGAVVAAGLMGKESTPTAWADWRRQVRAGAN